jgi:prefoldin subunit 5
MALKIEARVMQDIREVLRHKEQQLEQLQKEIEALRLSVKILEEADSSARGVGPRPVENLKDNGTRASSVPLKQFP